MIKIKYTLLFIASICLYNYACGQHFVGIKNSYSFNDISSLPKLYTKSVATINNPALVYNYTHRNFAAVQLELSQVNKGYELEPDTARRIPAIRHNITAIEIPVSTQLFMRFGMFRPYFTGGATVGYITKRTVDSLSIRRDFVPDQYDRRFEYGLTVGGGTGINLNRFELQLEARYFYNFSFLRQPVISGQNNRYINTTRLAISLALLYKL